MIWHLKLIGGAYDRYEGWPTEQPTPVLVAWTEGNESRLSSDIENAPAGAVEYRLTHVDLDRRAARYEVLEAPRRSVVERVHEYIGPSCRADRSVPRP